MSKAWAGNMLRKSDQFLLGFILLFTALLVGSVSAGWMEVDAAQPAFSSAIPINSDHESSNFVALPPLTCSHDIAVDSSFLPGPKDGITSRLTSIDPTEGPWPPPSKKGIFTQKGALGQVIGSSLFYWIEFAFDM